MVRRARSLRVQLRGRSAYKPAENPDQLSDEQWGDYVFFRTNPLGVHYERWVHTHGCRRWFNAARHTVTDEFFGSYKPGEAPPSVPQSES
jgi:sarcosine oxidase, subunit delta